MAYSGPFAATAALGDGASMGNGISFQIVALRSGETKRLEPDTERKRICSVGEGVVRVRLDDAEDFRLSSRGVFVVQPGKMATVVNWYSRESVLHVTAVEV
jgi:hypothetical protein